jgi:hypothetical protein
MEDSSVHRDQVEDCASHPSGIAAGPSGVIDPRFVLPGFLRTNATLVTQKVNISVLAEEILQRFVENASVLTYALVDSQMSSRAMSGLPGFIAVSSTEAVPPGIPAALKS